MNMNNYRLTNEFTKSNVKTNYIDYIKNKNASNDDFITNQKEEKYYTRHKNNTPEFLNFNIMNVSSDYHSKNLSSEKKSKRVTGKLKGNIISEDNDIDNFIEEASNCIKNHITDTNKSMNINLRESNINIIDRTSRNEHIKKLDKINKSLTKIIKKEDSFLLKIHQEKMNKKQKDIGITIEEIKQNLNSLSQKIKIGDNFAKTEQNFFKDFKDNEYKFNSLDYDFDSHENNKIAMNNIAPSESFNFNSISIKNSNNKDNKFVSKVYKKSYDLNAMNYNERSKSKYNKIHLNEKDKNLNKVNRSFSSGNSLEELKTDESRKKTYINEQRYLLHKKLNNEEKYHIRNKNPVKDKSVKNSDDYNTSHAYRRPSGALNKNSFEIENNNNNEYLKLGKSQSRSISRSNINNKSNSKEKKFSNNRNKFQLDELNAKNSSIQKGLLSFKKNLQEIEKGTIQRYEEESTSENHIDIKNTTGHKLNGQNDSLLFKTLNPEDFGKIHTKKKIKNDQFLSYSNSKENIINKSDKYEKNHVRKNKSYFGDVMNENSNDEKHNENEILLDYKGKNPSSNKINNNIEYIGPNVRNKSKEKENYRFYYIKKNQNIKSAGPDNPRDKCIKSGRISCSTLNNNPNKGRISQNKKFFNTLNVDRNNDEASYIIEKTRANKSLNKGESLSVIEIQSNKIISLEKKLDNAEEKITNYKNLINEYMPEDIDPGLFSVINGFLSGKDRWFLVKRNSSKQFTNNLFWVRETQLFNLGFSINFNLFKDDNFDLCLLTNNMNKTKEENKRFLVEIEDLKSFLHDEIGKKDKLLNDKIAELKKMNDKNKVLTEYISKLEFDKQNQNINPLNSEYLNQEKIKFDSEIKQFKEDNSQLRAMVDDFQINIKNLLEDNLKFKSENEKLIQDITILKNTLYQANNNLNPTNINNLNNYKNNPNRNFKDNSNSNTPRKGILSKDFINENSAKENEENSNSQIQGINLNSKDYLKNKLKESILENLLNDNNLLKKKKEDEDVSQNSKLKAEVGILKKTLEETTQDLNNVTEKLLQYEKEKETLTREKEKLKMLLESEKEKIKKIIIEKEYLEIEKSKIPELIKEELYNYKKTNKNKYEEKDKKIAQLSENLEILIAQKSELENKLTEIVELYNEVIEINKNHEIYIKELEESLVNNENNKPNLEENESAYKKEIQDLKEMLKIKDDNNSVLNKTKSILESEIKDLKIQNRALIDELEILREDLIKSHSKDYNNNTHYYNNVCINCKDKINDFDNTENNELINPSHKNKKLQIEKQEKAHKQETLPEAKEFSKNQNNSIYKNDSNFDEINDIINSFEMQNLEDNENELENNSANRANNSGDKRQSYNSNENKRSKNPKNYDIPLQRNQSKNSNNISNKRSPQENNNDERNNNHTNINQRYEIIIEELNQKLTQAEKLLLEKDEDIHEFENQFNIIKDQVKENYIPLSQIEQILSEVNVKHNTLLENYMKENEEGEKNLLAQIDSLTKYQESCEGLISENSMLKNKLEALEQIKAENVDKANKIKDLEKKLLKSEEKTETIKELMKNLEKANYNIKDELQQKDSELNKIKEINLNHVEKINSLHEELKFSLSRIDDLQNNNLNKQQLEAQYEINQIKKHYENKLANYETEISKLRSLIENEEIQNIDLKSKLSTLTQKYSIIESENSSNIKQVEILKDAIAKAEAEQATKLQLSSKIIFALESEKKNVENEILMKEKALAEKANEITILKNSIKNLENENTKNIQYISNLELQIGNYASDNNMLNQLIKTIKIESETFSNKLINESNTKIEALEQTLKQSNQNYEKLFEENEEYKSEIQHWEKNEKILKEKILISENNLQNIAKKNMESEEQLIKMKNIIVQLEKNEEHLKMKNALLEKNIDHMHNNNQSESDKVLIENQTLTKENQNLTLELDKLNHSLKQKEEDISKETEKINTITNEFNILKTTLVDKDDHIAQLSKNLQSYKNNDQKYKEEINYLNTTISKITEQLVESQKLNSDLNEIKQAYEAKIASIESEKHILTNKVLEVEDDFMEKVEQIKHEYENVINSKIEQIVQEKNIEIAEKKEFFTIAQENSLRDLNKKFAEYSTVIKENENAFEEYKSKKKQKIKTLKAEILQMSTQKEHLMVQIMEKDKYINEILTDLENKNKLDSDYLQHMELQRELNSQIENLKKVLKEKELQSIEQSNTINTLNVKLLAKEESSNKNIQELNENIEMLNKQITNQKIKYDSAIKSLDQIISQKVEENEGLKKQIILITQDINMSKALNEEKEALLSKLELTKNAIIEENAKQIKEIINQYNLEKENYEKEIQQLKNNLNSLNSQVNNHNLKNIPKTPIHKKSGSINKLSENAYFSQKNSDNDEKRSHLTDDFKDLDLSLTSEDREKEILFKHEDCINQVQTLKEQNKNNENIINHLNQQLSLLEHDIKIRDSEVSQLKEKLGIQDGIINQLEASAHTYKGKISELEYIKNSLEGNIKDQNQKLKSLSEINSQLNLIENHLKEEFNKERNELKNLIDRLTTANEKYLNRINELNEEMVKMNDCNLRSSHEVQNTSSVNNEEIEIELLKDELKQKDQKMMDIKEEMIKLKITIEENVSEIKKKHNEIYSLKELNKELNEKMISQNHNIDYLKETINSLEETDKYRKNTSAREIFINLAEQVEYIAAMNNKSVDIVQKGKYDEISENYEDEIINFKIQIESLKEIIYQKENEALKILEENNNLKSELDKLKKTFTSSINNVTNSEENQLFNINANFSSAGFSKNSEEIKDDSNMLMVKEKYIKLKSSLDHYKADNANLLQQMNLLKLELKNQLEKYDKVVSFEGKIANFEELCDLIHKIVEGYKPKNKTQEEAFKKLYENFAVLFLDTDKDKDKVSIGGDLDKKKGFFDFLKKKK